VGIISHGGTIMLSIDTEEGADKGMQIHSGILMNLNLKKSVNEWALMEINSCMEVH